MPVGGFVLTLADEVQAGSPLLTALANTPGVTLGAPHGQRVPLVLESDNARAIDEACAELGAHAGVLLVELAYADFSDLEDPSDYQPLRRNRHVRGGHDGPA